MKVILSARINLIFSGENKNRSMTLNTLWQLSCGALYAGLICLHARYGGIKPTRK